MISTKSLKKTIFSIALFFTLMVSGLPVYAIKAFPGLIECAQPDGSTARIRLEGDFHNRRAFSEDGYALTVDNEGFYVFANLNSSGIPYPTGIREINPESRSSATISFLEKINKDDLRTAFEQLKTNNQPATRGPGLFDTSYPTSGEQRGLVILVDFPDCPFTIEEPAEFFTRMLNEEGFSDYKSTGSARDYFIENSMGRFIPEFDVYGPVTLPENYSYYGKNNAMGEERNAPYIVIDACELLDEQIEFPLYDCDGDGYVDMIYVYYAGFGEADGGNANTIWPHSWYIEGGLGKTFTFDEVKINKYACSNELQFYGKKPDGIGSFVHEFSHVLGLPDLYSTNGNSLAFTPQQWSVLDVGSYNNNSRTPPNYSSFERFALDWMEPERIAGEGLMELENLADSNKAYIFYADNKNEYFLIENRQQTGNDTYLPGHGMLVWHIDYKDYIWNQNNVNNHTNHQYVDLIEADQILTFGTLNGDSFPGQSKITQLTPDTHQSYRTWGNKNPLFSFTDITEDEGIITFMCIETETESGIDEIKDNVTGINISGKSVWCNNGHLDVYDLTGRKITEISSIPVSFSPGIYLARSSSGLSQKFIIN